MCGGAGPRWSYPPSKPPFGPGKRVWPPKIRPDEKVVPQPSEDRKGRKSPGPGQGRRRGSPQPPDGIGSPDQEGGQNHPDPVHQPRREEGGVDPRSAFHQNRQEALSGQDRKKTREVDLPRTFLFQNEDPCPALLQPAKGRVRGPGSRRKKDRPPPLPRKKDGNRGGGAPWNPGSPSPADGCGSRASGWSAGDRPWWPY